MKWWNSKNRTPTGDELLTATREFLQSFEDVFDVDWEYTKSQLGVPEESAEQAKAGEEFGLESIPMIAPDRTFLRPGVDDEIEDWGNRAKLLDSYRRLKKLIQSAKD